MQPKGASPYAAPAPPDSAPPLVFTAQKGYELPLLGERSHQLFALLSG